MSKLRAVSIVCAQCKKRFNYETRSNILKTFCPVCAKKRIDESKKRSKEKILEDGEEELSKEELERRLDAIPDKEHGWNTIFNFLNKKLL